MEYKLILGDCLDKLKELEDNSIDSIVTDPPYGISFMGSKWDYDVPKVDVWKECLRVLKPGGHLLSFSSARTYHRMVVNVEDAGFEIREQIMWVFGSGFPKSHNIGKAIDKKLGNKRDIVGEYKQTIPQITPWKDVERFESKNLQTKGESDWEGWGTALKPAHEPIVMARKPFKGDVASNVIKYGTGAINIDGCRVGTEEITINKLEEWSGFGQKKNPDYTSTNNVGRFPANFIHDGLDEEWSKYFYCAKANKNDRNEGCEDLKEKQIAGKGNGLARTCETCGANTLQGCECEDRTYSNPKLKNHHPTVKPTDLMRYLCRLITPKNGTILDPFMGSGSTGKAAMLEGFNFVGIELSEEYLEIAEKRIKNASDR